MPGYAFTVLLLTITLPWRMYSHCLLVKKFLNTGDLEKMCFFQDYSIFFHLTLACTWLLARDGLRRNGKKHPVCPTNNSFFICINRCFWKKTIIYWAGFIFKESFFNIQEKIHLWNKIRIKHFDKKRRPYQELL